MTVSVRICMVTSSFPRHAEDGYARFVLEQAKSLRLVDPDGTVVVVAPHADGLRQHELIEGIEVRRFRYFLPTAAQRLAYRHEGLFETLRTRRWLVLQLPFFVLAMGIALLRHSRGATIIHAQWLPTAGVAWPAASLRRVPLVVSARGADVSAGKLQAFPLRQALSRTGSLLAVSADMATRLRKILPDVPVATLYNGVDTARFRARVSEATASVGSADGAGREILFVGGLIRRKRVDTLLRALAILHADDTLPTPTLHVAGEGPLEASLRATARELGIEEHVEFAGRLDRDRVARRIAIADVLVLPSESEGRPNVVLEAFASETAVIATRVDGTRELVRHGHRGLLFDVGDERGLAEALHALLGNDDLRTRVAAAGRRFLDDEGLTWQAHGERLHAIYERLTSRGSCAE